MFGCVSAREICQVEVESHSKRAGPGVVQVRKCCSHPECGEIWHGTAARNTNGEEESQLLVMGRAWPTQYVAASALALTNPEWSVAFLLLVDSISARVLLHCQIRWNTQRKWLLTIWTGYQFELVSVASHFNKLIEAK